MAGLLAHALAAMAFSAFLGAVLGLPAISYGIFVAGFFAMLIEMDLDELSPSKRSPVGHSIFFGVIWIVIVSVSVWAFAFTNLVSEGVAKELTLAIISAFGTHLTIDSLTKEGIYTFPKGSNARRWITRLSKGDEVCWEYWRFFKNEKLKDKLRKNDDPILNACVSLPSLLIIIIFVAAMPIPV